MTWVNGIELILFIGAFWLSRSKMIPILLVVYAFLCYGMTSYFDSQYEKMWVDHIFGRLSESAHSEGVLLIYLSQGVAMLGFAVLIQIVTLYRWANVKMMWITALCIFFQSLCSLYMYFSVKQDVMFALSSALYSSINEKFVIIYIVIAWMTVYFSRKESK